MVAATADERLGGPLVDRDRQACLGDDSPHGPGLLPHAIGKLDFQIGPENRQEHTGQPATGADIEDALAGGEMPGHGDRIGDIARHKPLDIAVAGQIQALVPSPEARRVGRQARLDTGRERERQPLTLRPDGPGEC